MAEPSETSRPREAPAAEAATRIAPRRRTADQRLRIQERLTMGLTVAHIARVEQVTVRRVRQIIAEMLATRTSERLGRMIDQDGLGSMESKKREGYF